MISEVLLAARGALFEQWQKLEKPFRLLARQDRRVQLLITVPGVGPIVGLTYASAIDDPGRFRSSKAVGAHFGLIPRKYESGETDVAGRNSKIGDGGVRTALYEAANVILTRSVKGSTLKSWGMRLAARAGMRKAKVARARKLAVVLHRLLADGTTFLADKGLRRPPTNNGDSGLGRFETPAVRSTVPSPGRWIRSGRPHLIRASLPRVFRWPTCSSSNPIRWQPSTGK
jgi:hypothetical protein